MYVALYIYKLKLRGVPPTFGTPLLWPEANKVVPIAYPPIMSTADNMTICMILRDDFIELSSPAFRLVYQHR